MYMYNKHGFCSTLCGIWWVVKCCKHYEIDIATFLFQQYILHAVYMIVVILHLSAAEDVEEQVVTKTTKIVEKSAPEGGLSLVVIVNFCMFIATWFISVLSIDMKLYAVWRIDAVLQCFFTLRHSSQLLSFGCLMVVCIYVNSGRRWTACCNENDEDDWRISTWSR